ncbi:putative nucleotidyltransferase substrate binding domain-containing protein [Eilatimonas milleporae]|uniref:CBS domain-containing protein n=1 Tax=Eilatimonas milleporae TaxID=911205 RepID=A0A3M0CMM5_9PROT|nr:putative nucleotidyltransferase substrate binding domain-containing protein [Eilatimonas milleporae]RMB08206.1 CBS domain-containing protein [Eilatimonas milleporae]
MPTGPKPSTKTDNASTEQQEVIDFLAATVPFDGIPHDAAAAAAMTMAVRYARRGSVVVGAGTRNDHLYLVRSGAVELHEGGTDFHARLGEGCFFAYPSLLRGGERRTRNEVRAIEDTLLYCLPGDVFLRLYEDQPAIRRFFATAEADRLRHALSLMGRGEPAGCPPGQRQEQRQEQDQGQEHEQEQGGDLTEARGFGLRLGDLVGRAPVTAPSQTPLRQAAQVMAREKVSTLMVVDDGRLTGIVSDKDIRSRAVAEGLAYDTPLSAIMTPEPVTLAAGAPVMDALVAMMERNFHHVPVLAADGALAGLVSSNDILDTLTTTGLHCMKAIARAETVAAAVSAGAGAASLIVDLSRAGLAATRILEIRSAISAALHRRLVHLAEAALGPPPVPYAFQVFGSLARRDQTGVSDQDNGLILSDDYDEDTHGDYFRRLATQISDGLNAAGFVYCQGGIMATNDRWRQPLAGWRRQFSDWITAPEPKALMHATIFFDMDGLAGDLSLVETLRAHALDMAARNRIFLAHMVENALTAQVPLGFFRRFVLTRDKEQGDTLDIKKQGVMPLIDIVRVHALAHGIAAVGTEARLDALAAAGALSPQDVQDMKDTFTLLSEVRLQHQVAQLAEGRPADNRVDPDTLSPLEREHLRDAFSVIRTHQEALSRTYAGGLF